MVMGHVVVEIVGLLVAQALANIFHDEGAFSNGSGGVATAGVMRDSRRIRAMARASMFSTIGLPSGKGTSPPGTNFYRARCDKAFAAGNMLPEVDRMAQQHPPRF